MVETNEPRLLIIETSSRSGLAAMALGPNVLGMRRLDEARHHARDLVPAVSELLAAQNWRARDLQAVIVSRGPGSYTGLRVGIMSARTLAYATGCALIAVDTFAAIAQQVPEGVDRVDVIADAQQQRVYVQEFSRVAGTGQWRPVKPLAIQALVDWLSQRNADAWITGPGLQVYRSQLPESAAVVASEYWPPQAESLLHIGLERYQAGERDDIWALEPLYLRPSSAEEKFGRKP